MDRCKPNFNGLMDYFQESRVFENEELLERFRSDLFMAIDFMIKNCVLETEDLKRLRTEGVLAFVFDKEFGETLETYLSYFTEKPVT